MIFGIKKNDNFDPYNVFLAIATNIPQRIRLLLCSTVTYIVCVCVLSIFIMYI